MTTIYKEIPFADAIELIGIGKHCFYAHEILKLHLMIGCGCTHCFKSTIEDLASLGVTYNDMHDCALKEARASGKMSEEELEELDNYFRAKNLKGNTI